MTRQLKVLLAEDEPLQMIHFEEILYDRGYSVSSAQNGSQAFSLAANYHFDAVITDMDMLPDDGIFLLELLNEVGKKTLPVLVHSNAQFYFSKRHGKVIDLKDEVSNIYKHAEFRLKDLEYNYMLEWLESVAPIPA